MKRRERIITPELRQSFSGRLLEVGSIVILVGALVMAYQYTKEQRQHVRHLEQTQDEQPRIAAEQLQQQAVLETHRAELTRLEQQLVSYEAVGQFIEQLEKQATARQIILRVPDIKEHVQYGANGKPIPGTGPMYEIDVTLLAVGSPRALLEFLHELEHAPYLSRVSDWKLDIAGRQVPGLAGHATSPEAEKKFALPQSTLDAHLILAVRNHETQP